MKIESRKEATRTARTAGRMVLEPLEDRRLMSATSHAALALSAAGTHASAVIRTARAHQPIPATFGALGDSYVDEYAFYRLRSKALNFVEQLSQAGIAYYGKFSATPRSDIRAAGYANNWAVSGAFSTDLAGQVTGLLPAVKAGTISYVTLSIGGNDFEADVVARKPAKLLEALPSVVFANIQAAVARLLNANPNVKVIVATLQDLESTPRLENLVSSGTVTAATLSLADIEQRAVNALILKMARHSTRIAVADFQSQLNAVESQPTLTLNGVQISTTTTGSAATNLFVSDGEHPGTVEQGLFGNLFITAIDSKFGASLATLTNAQILAAAGLA